jgi:hypothetical protein
MNIPESGHTLRSSILGLLDTFLRDLKHTFRALVRTPAFTKAWYGPNCSCLPSGGLLECTP